MGLYDISNSFDQSANAANPMQTSTTGSTDGGSVLGGLGSSVSSVIGNAGSAISTTANSIGSSVLGGIENAVSNFPSAVGNIVQSTISQAATYTVMAARSFVSQKVTGLLNSVIPRTSYSILNSIGGQVAGSVNNSAGVILNGGVNQIFGAIGINGGYSPVQQSNPVAYQAGVSAAQTLVNQVNGGNTNVNGMVATALNPLANLQYLHQTSLSLPTTSGNVAQVSPYAMDLISFAPKYNYLFVVEFQFTPGFEALGQLNGQRSKFAMIVQEFDRPKISYEHEEFNWYNFRSKYAKRVVHENLRLKMIDDRQNASMNFITNYLLASHPILGISPQSSFMYEQAGMNWGPGANGIDYDSVNSASLRGFAGDELFAIQQINVYHVYDYGRSMNVYHFIRPKIVGIELDRWDMKGSPENCTIEAEFVYDGLYIETGVAIQAGENQKIELLTQAQKFPMRPQQTSTSNPSVTAANAMQGQTTSDPSSVTPTTFSSTTFNI